MDPLFNFGNVTGSNITFKTHSCHKIYFPASSLRDTVRLNTNVRFLMSESGSTEKNPCLSNWYLSKCLRLPSFKMLESAYDFNTVKEFSFISERNPPGTEKRKQWYIALIINISYCIRRGKGVPFFQ